MKPMIVFFSLTKAQQVWHLLLIDSYFMVSVWLLLFFFIMYNVFSGCCFPFSSGSILSTWAYVYPRVFSRYFFFFICMLYSLWNGTSILSNNTHFIYDILCCTIDNFSNSLKWRILINYFSWRVIDIAWGLFPSSYFFIVQLLTRLIWNLLQSEYVEYKIVDMVVLLS